jgi:hypothetical protein
VREMAAKRLLMGLRARCKVAWRIENLFGHQMSGPFDWLVTRFKASQ